MLLTAPSHTGFLIDADISRCCSALASTLVSASARPILSATVFRARWPLLVHLMCAWHGLCGQLAVVTLGQLSLITMPGAGSMPWQTQSLGNNVFLDVHTSSWFLTSAVGIDTTSTALATKVGNVTSSMFSVTYLASLHSLVAHLLMVSQRWMETSSSSTIY